MIKMSLSEPMEFLAKAASLAVFWSIIGAQQTVLSAATKMRIGCYRWRLLKNSTKTWRANGAKKSPKMRAVARNFGGDRGQSPIRYFVRRDSYIRRIGSKRTLFCENPKMPYAQFGCLCRRRRHRQSLVRWLL